VQNEGGLTYSLFYHWSAPGEPGWLTPAWTETPMSPLDTSGQSYNPSRIFPSPGNTLFVARGAYIYQALRWQRFFRLDAIFDLLLGAHVDQVYRRCQQQPGVPDGTGPPYVASFHVKVSIDCVDAAAGTKQHPARVLFPAV